MQPACMPSTLACIAPVFAPPAAPAAAAPRSSAPAAMRPWLRVRVRVRVRARVRARARFRYQIPLGLGLDSTCYVPVRARVIARSMEPEETAMFEVIAADWLGLGLRLGLG